VGTGTKLWCVGGAHAEVSIGAVLEVKLNAESHSSEHCRLLGKAWLSCAVIRWMVGEEKNKQDARVCSK
jgi:hypothetical protein